jgi:hypothetical protein
LIRLCGVVIFVEVIAVLVLLGRVGIAHVVDVTIATSNCIELQAGGQVARGGEGVVDGLLRFRM